MYKFYIASLQSVGREHCVSLTHLVVYIIYFPRERLPQHESNYGLTIDNFLRSDNDKFASSSIKMRTEVCSSEERPEKI